MAEHSQPQARKEPYHSERFGGFYGWWNGSISSGTGGVAHPSYRLMRPFEQLSELPDDLLKERLALYIAVPSH